MSKLLAPATFLGYSTRADGSCVLRFETQEQTPAQVALLHAMRNEFGAFYFVGNSEITQAEKEELDALQTDIYDNPKTSSQRFRNVLFKLWKQDAEGFEDFAKYYRHRMNALIEHYKAKIEP
ncbi:MAG TPA: hypothetical protein PLZ24_16610 [Flavobacteriales bacterium]|nr:hypothetical protein [Flavobacteriales bacterium]